MDRKMETTAISYVGAALRILVTVDTFEACGEGYKMGGLSTLIHMYPF